MDFIKRRWSTNDEQVNQPQSIETSNNAVKFTNARTNNQNPIIISTQHPSSISIVREFPNPTSLRVLEAVSPTDSYHSVASNFHDERKEGKMNVAYHVGSSDMSRQSNRQENHTQCPQNR